MKYGEIYGIETITRRGRRGRRDCSDCPFIEYLRIVFAFYFGMCCSV
jgi:hypothetical protein